MIARPLACALALIAFPAMPRAQSLPPNVRACAAESDADRRHACYDREVGRILAAEKGSATSGSPLQNRAAPPAAAASRSLAGRQSPSPSQNAPARTAAVESRDSSTANSRDQFSARIVSVDSTPDELILHLDNGEVWEQADRTSGGLGLRSGDTVTIAKHLGSFWLSARHVSGMKVRKRSD